MVENWQLGSAPMDFLWQWPLKFARLRFILGARLQVSDNVAAADPDGLGIYPAAILGGQRSADTGDFPGSANPPARDAARIVDSMNTGVAGSPAVQAPPQAATRQKSMMCGAQVFRA